MTDPKILEAIISHVLWVNLPNASKEYCLKSARTVLAIVAEEFAKIALQQRFEPDPQWDAACVHVAAVIRQSVPMEAA